MPFPCFGILTIVGAPSLEGQIFGVMLILGGTHLRGQVLIRRLKGALTGFQLTAWMGVMAGPQMILAAMLFEGDLVRQISTAPMVAWGTLSYTPVQL